MGWGDPCGGPKTTLAKSGDGHGTSGRTSDAAPRPAPPPRPMARPRRDPDLLAPAARLHCEVPLNTRSTAAAALLAAGVRASAAVDAVCVCAALLTPSPSSSPPARPPLLPPDGADAAAGHSDAPHGLSRSRSCMQSLSAPHQYPISIADKVSSRPAHGTLDPTLESTSYARPCYAFAVSMPAALLASCEAGVWLSTG